MLFGLVNDGKVDAKGRPHPLQAAVIAREFSDVVVFTSPPPVVQRFLIGILAPIGTLFGYRAIHADYCKPHRHIVPDAEILKAAGLPVQ